MTREARLQSRAGKNLCFYDFLGFLGFNSGHKIMTRKQRFGHVNATYRSYYLNVICIKLVTQLKKSYRYPIRW